MNSSTCFYVIIEPSAIDDRQLRMPDRFVQVHGNELLNTVRLVVPTDEFWCVGLKKVGQTIWLDDGWQEFIEHHSIDYWYFLFFKYEQNSCFNVHIFDLTATEIHYQLRSHDNAESCENRQDLSHGKEIVFVDTDGESSVEIMDPLLTESQSSAKSYELSRGTKRRKIAPGMIKYWRCYETRSRARKWHDEGRVLDAKNLNIVRDSSVTKPLMGKSVQQNMNASTYAAVVVGGATNQDNALEGSKNGRLQSNEKKHIESSDAFGAVTSNRTNCKIDASKSFTGQQLGNPIRRRGRPRKSEQLRTAEANKAMKATKMCMPENPHFRQILDEHNVVRSYVLYIPADFVQKYMTNTSEVIKLQDSACNQWDVQCVRRKYDMHLSKGWRNFVKDNNLMVGDVCVFELIKDLQADELMLKVHIVRSKIEENSTHLHTCSVSEPKLPISKSSTLQLYENKHTENSDIFGAVSSNRTNWKTDESQSFPSQQLEKSVRRERPHKRGRSSSKENTTINAAKCFIPKNPYFRTILEKYNVKRSYILNIPSEFAREFMPKTSDVIELQDSDGNKWNVRCIRMKHQLCLSKGWSKFVKDKSLAEGDACFFELIKDIQTSEIMLKVYIFHSWEEENSTLQLTLS